MPGSPTFRRSKFGNKKTTAPDGTRFDSKKEAQRYGQLRLLERAGEIRNLRLQVPFELIPKQPGERACTYVADFVYECAGATIVEDCKGMRTPDYVIKRKLMLRVHGVRIQEWPAKAKGRRRLILPAGGTGEVGNG